MDDFYSREITLADMPFLMHQSEEGTSCNRHVVQNVPCIARLQITSKTIRSMCCIH